MVYENKNIHSMFRVNTLKMNQTDPKLLQVIWYSTNKILKVAIFMTKKDEVYIGDK